ncbi:hypothetical protein Ddye_002159 [Dipteronia dyeriana]|uniref:Uncharacterized protein n=1 Tax=Dipteronia dyeriana TaxID=168575 RepID=A0AAD9XQ97_9ROSI|nr:hypothetical protein Ddye_002159 [Dipteronia dyeriana]
MRDQCTSYSTKNYTCHHLKSNFNGCTYNTSCRISFLLFHGDHDDKNSMGFNEDTTFDHYNYDPFIEKNNNMVMNHEDIDIVGDDCADTDEDGHANTMGVDFANPNVNLFASDPELWQEDNVHMSNLVSRVVNSTIPPSSKASLVAVDENVDIEIGGLSICKKQLRLHLEMVRRFSFI